MSENTLPRVQDEFFSVEAVEDFYQEKLPAFDEMQSQAIIDTLKNLGKLGDGQKLGTLLDIGCGYGVVTSLMAKHFEHAVGIDLSANMIRKAHELGHSDHIQFKVGSGDILPIADGSVDVITSIFSIHHLDMSRFAPECRRVLKPGGVAVFYTDFLSMLTSLEDDKLPSIVDEIKQMITRCLAIARSKSHPERFLLDDFQALYKLINWPKKERITRKVHNEITLKAARGLYLAIPMYSTMADEENPIIHAFNKINRVWNLGNDEDVAVRATWDAGMIVLHQEKY